MDDMAERAPGLLRRSGEVSASYELPRAHDDGLGCPRCRLFTIQTSSRMSPRSSPLAPNRAESLTSCFIDDFLSFAAA